MKIKSSAPVGRTFDITLTESELETITGSMNAATMEAERNEGIDPGEAYRLWSALQSALDGEDSP